VDHDRLVGRDGARRLGGRRPSHRHPTGRDVGLSLLPARGEPSTDELGVEPPPGGQGQAFSAEAFLAGARLAGAFFAAAFFAAAFFAGAVLAGPFFAAAFFAAAFLARPFSAAAFFAGAFLAGPFSAAAFLPGAFFATERRLAVALLTSSDTRCSRRSRSDWLARLSAV